MSNERDMRKPEGEHSTSAHLVVRPSGYVSRLEEIFYGISGPLYDILIWWCTLPLDGEKACRKEFVRWFDVKPGHKVLSLCCGTGTTELALIHAQPSAQITAIDLGSGQIATAKQKDKSGLIDFRIGNASDTGFGESAFDRVLITGALHEMPRQLRLEVLREATRVCCPGGRVIAIEPALLSNRISSIIRSMWWFTWVPGNPESSTTRDLQRNGLTNEMKQAGLRVINRFTPKPEWIEGVVGEPNHVLGILRKP